MEAAGKGLPLHQKVREGLSWESLLMALVGAFHFCTRVRSSLPLCATRHGLFDQPLFSGGIISPVFMNRNNVRRCFEFERLQSDRAASTKACSAAVGSTGASPG